MFVRFLRHDLSNQYNKQYQCNFRIKTKIRSQYTSTDTTCCFDDNATTSETRHYAQPVGATEVGVACVTFSQSACGNLDLLCSAQLLVVIVSRWLTHGPSPIRALLVFVRPLTIVAVYLRQEKTNAHEHADACGWDATRDKYGENGSALLWERCIPTAWRVCGLVKYEISSINETASPKARKHTQYIHTDTHIQTRNDISYLISLCACGDLCVWLVWGWKHITIQQLWIQYTSHKDSRVG